MEISEALAKKLEIFKKEYGMSPKEYRELEITYGSPDTREN